MIANRSRRTARDAARLLLHWSLAPLLCLSMTMAQGAVLTCATAAASVPVLDPTATSAEVGDLTLACSGGVETDPLPTVNFQAFFNAPLLQDVDPVLTDGTTLYTGTFSGTNSVLFAGIPVNPFASLFTFDQIFVDPSLLLAGQLVQAFLSAAGEISLPIFNPQQTLAINGTVNAVPEPATALLLAAACGGLFLLRRRREPISVRTLPAR